MLLKSLEKSYNDKNLDRILKIELNEKDLIKLISILNKNRIPSKFLLEKLNLKTDNCEFILSALSRIDRGLVKELVSQNLEIFTKMENLNNKELINILNTLSKLKINSSNLIESILNRHNFTIREFSLFISAVTRVDPIPLKSKIREKTLNWLPPLLPSAREDWTPQDLALVGIGLSRLGLENKEVERVMHDRVGELSTRQILNLIKVLPDNPKLLGEIRTRNFSGVDIHYILNNKLKIKNNTLINSNIQQILDNNNLIFLLFNCANEVDPGTISNQICENFQNYKNLMNSFYLFNYLNLSLKIENFPKIPKEISPSDSVKIINGLNHVGIPSISRGDFDTLLDSLTGRELVTGLTVLLMQPESDVYLTDTRLIGKLEMVQVDDDRDLRQLKKLINLILMKYENNYKIIEIISKIVNSIQNRDTGDSRQIRTSQAQVEILRIFRNRLRVQGVKHEVLIPSLDMSIDIQIS